METRQGIDLANYQIVNSKGRFGLTGIHFSYRKHTSQADYFLSYVEPIEGEIEEAIGVFDRYVVLESVVRKTMVDVVENGCTVRKLNFFFNVDRDKGSIYVKRKGIWEPCYISILPKFESLYEKWLIEKGEEHRGRIERWNNYIEVNLGLKQRRNGYGERS